MNYIGSKYKLIPFIQENIYAVVGQPFGCDFLRSVRWNGYLGVCVK
ncbi:PZ18b [Helicobacter pylori Hp P-16]|nr:PZ18b [Helicobacter pylori Hp P-16]